MYRQYMYNPLCMCQQSVIHTLTILNARIQNVVAQPCSKLNNITYTVCVCMRACVCMHVHVCAFMQLSFNYTMINIRDVCILSQGFSCSDSSQSL